MRTKTTQQAEKMLDAAARLFGSQRFHEVRMEDIAAEAEVGKGTLYRYFSDKEDLYLALLERASRQVLAGIELALAQVEGPRARLAALAEALIAFFDEQPHVFDLIQRAEVLRGSGRDFPWQRARDAVFGRVREIFGEGRAAGDFVVRDPEHALLMFLGGLRGVTRFGTKPRPRDLARRLVEDFLDGANELGRPAVPAPRSAQARNGGHALRR